MFGNQKPAEAMDALSSPAPVDDETAKVALWEFFQELAAHNPGDLKRVFQAFLDSHRDPVPAKDWADRTPDGNLSAGPVAISETNGR